MKPLKLSREIFNNIQTIQPIMHNIANIVSAADCANITLACGGSPTMADDPDEVGYITAASSGCVINMGNTGGFYQDTMLRTGRKNNELKHPIVLDPVGAGAAPRRNAVLKNLLDNIHFTLIRGNVSEIKYLGDKSSSAKGVDASEKDLANESNVKDIACYAKNLSARLDSLIVISGPIDVVADKDTAYLIRNGHSMMSRVTGTGCMLSSVLGVFISANPKHMLEAAAVAVSAYGYAGELAHEKVCLTQGGTGSMRMYLIDYMSTMNHTLLGKGANIQTI